MMKNVMGLVDLQRDDLQLRELTTKRTIASIPFAGRYRIVDFALSSMVNSGIRNVGVYLPEHSRSILDHLRSGKDWDLARHYKGLYYLPPVRAESTSQDGDMKGIYASLDYVDCTQEDYVVFARASAVYNMKFDELARAHVKSGADITMVVNPARYNDPVDGIVVRTADDGRVTDFAMRPNIRRGELRALGVYFMKRSVFATLVRETFEHGGSDFRRDLIGPATEKLNVYAYHHDGFAARICSVQAYYEISMEMLNPLVWRELFLKPDAPIYTKSKDMPPVRYKEGARVTNSLIANGCEIYGTVENSILFRGVRVAPGVHIRNSIIMEKCVIGEDARLDCVICDKYANITPRRVLNGVSTYPVYVHKLTTI